MIQDRAKESSPDLPSISTEDSAWKIECARLQREGVAFRVTNIAKAEHIQFVSAFAAVNKLRVTVEGRTFVLQPSTFLQRKT